MTSIFSETIILWISISSVLQSIFCSNNNCGETSFYMIAMGCFIVAPSLMHSIKKRNRKLIEREICELERTSEANNYIAALSLLQHDLSLSKGKILF